MVVVPLVLAALLATPTASPGRDDYPLWFTEVDVALPPAAIRTEPAYFHCWPRVTLLQLGNVGPVGPTVFVGRDAPVLNRVAGHSDPGQVKLLVAHQYVRDPFGEYPPETKALPFEPATTVPPDAVDTGLHQSAKRLWAARDGLSVYVGTVERAERWPARTLAGQTCD